MPNLPRLISPKRSWSAEAQGGIISPVLANLALDGLQARLARAFPGTRAGCARVNLIRYADDFVITGRSPEQLETQVRPLVEDFLAERGLTLSAEKTSITRVADGFDFLGQNIRRYCKKVLCKPSRRSLRLFNAGVRQVIRKHQHVDPATLIQLLNPKIEGWTRYHRHGTSKKVFERIDHLLFGLLWRWCQRRHPRKSAHWVPIATSPRSVVTTGSSTVGSIPHAARSVTGCSPWPAARGSSGT
jgi:RNA-directed DNA polymerase